MADQPLLFTPLKIAGVTLPNRIVISPMCQYSADEGMPNDWHFSHLSAFARGGAGLVFCEAAAVSPEGRITHGDAGIWNAEQAKAWQRITAFIDRMGSVPAIQIAHAGRKASMQRPWFGNGPVNDEDRARGDQPWPVIGPSPVPMADDWLVPAEMDDGEIARVRQAFADAAGRAIEAGFRALEIHGAHGYLIQSFLSPLSNKRNDAYGGDRNGRMRFALEVAEAVRAAWPRDLPLFFRVSSVDGIEGGWEIEDSIALAGELKERGIDVIDCSSGGNSPQGATNAPGKRGPGFQVPYADAIRNQAGIKTQAVGLILTAEQAEDILQSGAADLIAIARAALHDPFWPLHAAEALGADPEFAHWPKQYGWWLVRRARALHALSE
jgi:2,4-dienoyl-CoA reductase-like NADH-dependent reductase (Old Yellow Enzyme family)